MHLTGGEEEDEGDKLITMQMKENKIAIIKQHIQDNLVEIQRLTRDNTEFQNKIASLEETEAYTSTNA